MKRLSLYYLGLFGLVLAALSFSSCEEDPDPPVAEIFFTIQTDGFTVDFTSQTTNVTGWAWDFGDDTGTSIEENPTYTYASSGSYTVTLTATGDGGEIVATKSVDIEATVEEYLTGGPLATNGKTWVLSTTASPATDGVSAVSATFSPLYIPLINNALGLYALDDEYDNEYTFKWGGDYSVKGVNGAVLSGLIYSSVMAAQGMGSIVVMPNTTGAGLCGFSFTDVSDGTFTHTNGDLTINACNEDYPNGTTDAPADIVFSGVDYLTFSDGAHLGLLDFTGEVIIREISSDKMVVSMFLSSLYPDIYPEWFTKPSLCITATLVPKD